MVTDRKCDSVDIVIRWPKSVIILFHTDYNNHVSLN